MLTYTDFHAPDEPSAVVNGRVVPLEEAIPALAQNAMVLALSDPAYVEALAERLEVTV